MDWTYRSDYETRENIIFENTAEFGNLHTDEFWRHRPAVAKCMEQFRNRFRWQVLLLEVSKLLTVIPNFELISLKKIRLLRNSQLLHFGNDNAYHFMNWDCSSDLTSACSMPAVTWGSSRYCIRGTSRFLIRRPVYIIFSARIFLTTMECNRHSLWLLDSLCKVLFAPGHYIEETSGTVKPTTVLSLFLNLL
jgi:hypothetical protein